MPTDEELERLLYTLLDDAPLEPPLDRITALRARVAAERLQQRGGPLPTRLTSRSATRRGRWRPVLAVAACMVALAAGFVAARLLDRPDTSTTGEVEYEGQMQGADEQVTAAELIVVKAGIGRVVDLDTSVLPILPVSEFYEMWFVGPDDSPEQPNRISAGTFHPDPEGRSDVQFVAAVDPTKYPTVEITVEASDGDPSSTGLVVLKTVIG